MKSNKIRGIIFDYGGTLDTRGDHWSEVIWDGYQQCGIAIDKPSYRDAYVYGERALAVNPIVTPEFHFIDILREKFQLQLQFLCGCPLLPTGKDDDQRQAQLATHLEMSADEIGHAHSHMHQRCHQCSAARKPQGARTSAPGWTAYGARLQLLWQHTHRTMRCPSRRILQGHSRVGCSRRAQTQSRHIRPWSVRTRPASIRSVGSRRHLWQGHCSGTSSRLSHHLD